MLSKKHLNNVCMLGRQHKECRYLESDDFDYNKYYCQKHRPNEKKKIDIKLNAFVAECKRKGLDLAKQSKPLGDNCSGYALLKHKLQGIDVDKK